MNSEKIIKVLQTVRPSFFNLIKEARNIGDLEVIDYWVEKMLKERGFKFEVVEA